MEKEDQEFKAGLHTHMNPPTHTHHTNTQHIVLPPKKKQFLRADGSAGKGTCPRKQKQMRP